MSELWSDIALLIERGGFIMLPLLVLSIVSFTLVMERAWFWFLIHRPTQIMWLQKLRNALRGGHVNEARGLVKNRRSPYAEIAQALLDHGTSEAATVEALEMQRPKFDRFMVSLSTIITAAPLIGILGTVIGIIRSFNLLGGSEGGITDPSVVSHGIAEALLTTAMGLVVALMTLFPYMVYKGQNERGLGRVESIVAAAQQGREAAVVAESSEGTPAARPTVTTHRMSAQKTSV